MEEEVRRARGREFQIVGAAKRKDRRAWEDLKNGTVSRCWSEERQMKRKKERKMRGAVGNEKIVKIGRLIILQCFESDRSNLECDALGNRKPMQGTKSRRNVMGTANGRNNYSCKCILN